MAFRKPGPRGLKERLTAHMFPDALEEEFIHLATDYIPVFPPKVSSGTKARGLVLRRLDQSKFSRLGVFSF